MIDLKDFIIKEYYHSRGNVNKQKMYRFTCDKCNKDRGYLRKSSPIYCGSCSAKSTDQKEQQLKNRLRNNLRGRFYRAIKYGYKNGSAITDLGCTIEQFKIYIESLWQPGMNWDNWSKTGWHMDHILPLDSFNLKDREEVKRACHYTNIRPLWAKENLSKGNKLLTDIIREISI